MYTLLTLLQAVPPFHIQIKAGKPGPAGNPPEQRGTRYPTGRTGRESYGEQIVMFIKSFFQEEKKNT